MVEERKRPIHSLLQDEPRLQEEISEFVIGLAEAVDSLQDAYSAGDLPGLSQLASDLTSQATRYGYPPLAAAATAVRTACGEQNGEGVRKAIEETTEIARRIRLGHRGAA